MALQRLRRAGVVLLAVAGVACGGPGVDVAEETGAPTEAAGDPTSSSTATADPLRDGGTLVELAVDSSDAAQVAAVAQAVRRRLEALGTAFDVTIEGSRVTARVATQDSSLVEALLSGDGALQAALVERVEPMEDGALAAGDCGGATLVCDPHGEVAYELGPPVDLGPLEEVSLQDAAFGGPMVEVTLPGAVVAEWRALTAEAACRRDRGRPGQVALLVSGEVIGAPNMAKGVECGGGLATDRVSLVADDPERLAAELRGAYPVGVSLVQVTVAGPTG